MNGLEFRGHNTDYKIVLRPPILANLLYNPDLYPAAYSLSIPFE